MVDRKIYSEKFEPVVQPNEYIQTFPTVNYYIVKAIYPLPLLEVDLCDSDHLNANLTTTESAEVEIDDVYLDDLELAQLRLIPRDDFAVTWMAKPKARPYITTRNRTWQIQGIMDDARTNPANEHLQTQEIYQFEDTEFWIKAKANTTTLTTARLEFFGYRFILEKVTREQIPAGLKPTVIPTEG
ncbi:MAG: hypothetical protein QXI36_02130 [Candidatus Bathyarchaeia archaeon]